MESPLYEELDEHLNAAIRIATLIREDELPEAKPLRNFPKVKGETKISDHIRHRVGDLFDAAGTGIGSSGCDYCGG